MLDDVSLEGLLLVASAIAALAGLVALRRRRHRAWRRAARRLGLALRFEGDPPRPVLEGTLEGGYDVRVETVLRRERRGAEIGAGGVTVRTRLRVDGGDRIPGDLSLAPESTTTRLKRGLVGGADVDVGDAGFDEDVLVQGDPVQLRALLDASTRRTVRKLVGSFGGTVERGVLSAERDGLAEDAESLERSIAFLHEAARVLSLDDAAIPSRLAEIAVEDPEREVRERAFEALTGRFPDHAEAERATEILLTDPEPRLKELATRRSRGRPPAASGSSP